MLINVLRSFLSIAHATFVWAAPNELEGPGGKSDGRSAHVTDVRAPQKLEAAEMRGTLAAATTQCLENCIETPTYTGFKKCMKQCL